MPKRIKRKIVIAIFIILVMLFLQYQLPKIWFGDSIILGYALVGLVILICLIYIWFTISMERKNRGCRDEKI